MNDADGDRYPLSRDLVYATAFGVFLLVPLVSVWLYVGFLPALSAFFATLGLTVLSSRLRFGK